MSIQQFINNNNYVKSNVSQYLGAESLKNVFTNEVLKEYKEIINQYSPKNHSYLDYMRLDSTFNNNVIEKYVLINGKNYKYCNVIFNKNYKLYKRLSYLSICLENRRNGAGYLKVLNPFNFEVSTIFTKNYDVPTSVILQYTYFD
jgi:hypothetical protein